MTERTELADYIPLDDSLARRYRQVKRLGEGGQGSVVLAVDCRTDQEVALKALDIQGEQSSVERFLREARALASFLHPNLVRFLDLHADHTPPILVMEAIPGRPLERILQREGSFDRERLGNLGKDLAAVLELIHAKGCVHRDIKPANVVLSEERGPVLVDLGCAFLGEDTALTRTGVVVGTPAYLAPELLAGSPATPASDIFSLGVTLYRLATDELPYEIRDLLAAAGGAELPPEPAQRLVELLGPLGGKCLARQPRGRPSATDLVAAWKDPSRPMELTRVEAYAGDRSAGMPPVREGRPALGVATLGVLALLAGGWWLRGASPPEPAPTPKAATDSAGPPALDEAARLVDAAERLGAYHQVSGGGLATTDQPYREARMRVAESVDSLLEATYPLKVKRLLQALLTWVDAAGGAADGPEGRVLLAEAVTPVASVVARDLDLLRGICDPSFYEIEYSLSTDVASRRDRHRTLVEGLREMVTEVVEGWEARPREPPPPAAAELVLAELAEVVGAGGAEGALRRLADRPGAAGFLRQLEDFVICRPSMRGMRLTGVGCPTRRAIVAAATRRSPRDGGERLTRLVGRLATWWWCDLPLDAAEVAAVDADLEALRGARDLGDAARAQAVDFWNVAKAYWSAGKDTKAIMGRLDQLRQVLRGGRVRPTRSPGSAPAGL